MSETDVVEQSLASLGWLAVAVMWGVMAVRARCGRVVLPWVLAGAVVYVAGVWLSGWLVGAGVALALVGVAVFGVRYLR